MDSVIGLMRDGTERGSDRACVCVELVLSRGWWVSLIENCTPSAWGMTHAALKAMGWAVKLSFLEKCTALAAKSHLGNWRHLGWFEVVLVLLENVCKKVDKNFTSICYICCHFHVLL